VPKKKYAVGVDLGGTSIKVGLVDEKGKITKRLSLDSCAEMGPEKVIAQIKMGIKEISKGKRSKFAGIGIGAPGAVKLKKGTVENPPNFPGWGKIHLGNILRKEFKCDVFVENDANAAAVGELIYGSGRKLKNFVMITLGTGVGSGIISEKKIFRGETGLAGEIGHVSIDFRGEQCKCGSIGCIEAYIGSNYLIERTKKKLEENNNSILYHLTGGDLNLLTPKIISLAAEQNDEFAKSVIIDTGIKLGYVLSSTVHVLDISQFIIGGGLAGFGNLLLEAVENSIKERVMKTFRDRICVNAAKLKNDAGIKGASALVFYKS